MEMKASRESTALQMEEGRCIQYAATVSKLEDDQFELSSMQVASRETDTPELVLQEVYYSARDVARLERPLSALAMPPENFGFVLPGVFRSAYPQAQDYAYLRGLKLKTIVTLVHKDLPEGFSAFMKGHGIKHQVFGMEGTKKAEIPLAMMKSIVGAVMDRRNHPMLIHCNHGRHRTGCAVGVVRKFHGWDMASILHEYDKYAAPKPRETDVRYLNKFKLVHLKHLVAQKIQEPHVSIGQILFLLLVAALGLCVWLWTLQGLQIPTPAFRQPSTKKDS